MKEIFVDAVWFAMLVQRMDQVPEPRKFFEEFDGTGFIGLARINKWLINKMRSVIVQ